MNSNNDNKLNWFLEKLGFNKYERLAYSALLELKEATIPQIAKESRIPQSKAYEIVKLLEMKGAVAQTSFKPQKYKILSPGIAFAPFIEKSAEELQKKKSFLEELSKEFSIQKQTEEIQFIKGEENALNYIEKHLAENTQEEYLGVVMFEHANAFILNTIREKTNSGIRLWFVSPINKNNEEIARKYLKAGAQIRNCSEIPTPLRISVFDKKFGSFTITDSIGEWTTLWTNVKPTVKALETLFFHYWNEGKDFE